MESVGYITLQEAARRSGKTVEALKKQCQEGRLRGAIKQGNAWFVPPSEIVVSPSQENDGALLLALTMAESAPADGNIAITLYVHGIVLTGNLISRGTYFKQYREQLGSIFSFTGELEGEAGKESKQFMNQTLDTYFETVFKANETKTRPIHFIHLEDVKILKESGLSDQNNALLRVRLSSVDGFIFGRMNQG